ncbi:MAG: hypothetical protein AB1499_18675, partial [Nitrospirota bacterium]
VHLKNFLGFANKHTPKIKSAREVSKPKFSPFEKKQGLDADTASIIEGTNASVMNHSRLLWLKEALKATV